MKELKPIFVPFAANFLGLIIKVAKTIIKKVARGVLRRLGVHGQMSWLEPTENLMRLNRKKQGLQDKRQKVRTLVLGSSHADYGYLGADSFGYNLGLPSADLFTTYQLYKQNGRLLPSLENIVLFFSVFTPGYSLIRTREKFRCISYKFYFGVDYQDANLIPADIEARIFNSYKTISKDQLIPDYWGYESMPFFFASAVERASSHLRENIRDPDQMEWLKKTLDLATSRGQRLYLVIPPARSDYKANLPADHELFNKLYNLDISGHKLVNFFSSSIFDDHHMGDPDHMNRFGALKLAQELEQICGSVFKEPL